MIFWACVFGMSIGYCANRFRCKRESFDLVVMLMSLLNLGMMVAERW